MKYLFSICLFLLFALGSMAQEKHFIFIQSDSRQLFNVNLNGKFYSANASGFVIIPKLMEGEYSLVIGFPENTFPDQGFKCIIEKRDLGFELKNFGEKGWGLFNLQSLDVTMAGAAPAGQTATVPADKGGDEPISFDKKPVSSKPLVPVISTVDSQATNPVAKQAVEVQEARDTAVAITLPTRQEMVPNVITKFAEDKNNEGVSMSYTDANGAKADTIQLLIPAAKPAVDTLVKAETLPMSSSDSAVAAKIALLNERKDDVKLLEIDMNASGTDSVIISPPANVSAPPPVITPPVNEPDAPVVSPAVSVPVTDTATSVASSSVPVVVKKENSFCSNVATQEDYMRLRRKMALENTDDKMIREAKKMYRDKCFSTHQIKVLSTLFLSDEGRYRFFTASFSFVSDPASYSSLLSEFIDPFYINRFKSIVE